MKVSPYPQRTEGWHRARLGIPTASNANKLISANGKRSAQAKRYLYQLAWERVIGTTGAEDKSHIPAVLTGMEREDAAAERAAGLLGIELAETGLCLTDDGRFGCSPDRVFRGGAVEIKAPTGPTQIGYLLDGVGDAYVAQIAAYFVVGPWQRVHFISYHPEAPLYHCVFDREEMEPFTKRLRGYLAEFCDALDLAERKLRAMDWEWQNVLRNWPDEAGEPF